MSARKSRPSGKGAASKQTTTVVDNDTTAVTVAELLEDPSSTPADILDALGGDLNGLDDESLDSVIRADEGADGGMLTDAVAVAAEATLFQRREVEREQAAAEHREYLAELAAKVAAEKAAQTAQRREKPAPTEATGDLGDWLRETPWSDILVPAGFTEFQTDRQCGCPTWTAPGIHDSSKSAVTHECGDHADGGRLHIWSDTPQTSTPMDDAVADGRRDFSKLQALAFLAHDGDELAAMDAENIDRATVESFGRELRSRAAEVTRDDVIAAESEVFASDGLAAVHELARTNFRSPWSVLGSILTHVAAVAGPTATIDLGAGPAPLTLHTAVVGPSGSGKSLTEDLIESKVKFRPSPATRELVRQDKLDELVAEAEQSGEVSSGHLRQLETEAAEFARMWSPRLFPRALSTGQGFTAHLADELGATFGSRMMFSMDEIDALAVHGKARDSILLPSLNTGWTGGHLGQANADRSRRRVVPAKKYCYGLTVNVQPARSGPIFDGEASGGPQRYLWVPIELFSGAEEIRAAIEAEGDREMFDRPESAGRLTVDVAMEKPRRFVMPAKARKAYRLHALDAQTSRAWDTSVDSHRFLLQAKVAAGLAILDGALARDPDHRTSEWVIAITDETWDRAGQVLTVSTYTMAKCRAAVAATAAEESAARGKALHATDAARAEAEAHDVAEVADRLVKIVHEAGGSMALSKAKKRMTARRRPLAMRAIEDDDRLDLREVDGGHVLAVIEG